MKNKPCRTVRQIRKAAKSGDWSPQLRQHLDNCDFCREEEQMLGYFTMLSETLPMYPADQTAQQIWLQATVRQRQTAGQNMLRLTFLLQTGIQLLFTSILLLMLFWNWDNFNHWMHSLTSNTSIAPIESGLFIMLLVGVVILTANALASLNWIILKE